jgi:rod shape determining protein RodA
MRSLSWRNFDFILFSLTLILCIFGIAMIRSAAADNINLSEQVSRQPIYVVISLFVLFAAAVMDYHYLSTLARPLYLFIVVFLIVIFTIGQARFGAARWIDTGLVLIQPAELAKIIMIVVLADFFARSQSQPKDFRWVIRSFLLTAFVVVWIILQPNLSTTIVIFVLWFSMLWITGLPLKYFALFALVVVVVLGASFPIWPDYQQQRVLTFLFPDPTARHGNTYNVDQALITIGSGGLFGQGYRQGTQVQLRFLQVRHTDFIFAAVAEEFGFIGTVIVMLLLFYVVYRCFSVAKQAPDQLGSLIAYGVGVLIFFQTLVNIGVNLNVLPVTGLTLPFISYGGSSLLSLVLGVGLVESVSLRIKKIGS